MSSSTTQHDEHLNQGHHQLPASHVVDVVAATTLIKPKIAPASRTASSKILTLAMISTLALLCLTPLVQILHCAADNDQVQEAAALPLQRRLIFQRAASATGAKVTDDQQTLAAASASAASGERPRLIPLVAAESGYSENSSVNFLCTVSQGHHESLTFDWFKDGQPLSAVPAQPPSDDDFIFSGEPGTSSSASAQLQRNQQAQAPQIEKHADHSLLRIARVQANAHSGRYTCSAKNQFGQDSTSVNLLVNVKLQWIKEPAREIAVSLNQELRVDCLAQGEPRPSMRWEKLDSLQQQQQQTQQSLISKQQAGGSSGGGGSNNKLRQTTTTSASASGGALSNHYHIMESAPSSNRNQLAVSSGHSSSGGGKQSGHLHSYHNHEAHAQAAASPSASSSSSAFNEMPSMRGNGQLLVSSSRYLTIQRARESDAGIYECIASNGHDADLRKLVHVQVRGISVSVRKCQGALKLI